MWQWFSSVVPTVTITCAEIGNCSNKSKTLDAAMSNAIQLIIGLIGMLAVVFIVYGGIQFALSAGNAKQVQTAKQTITYAVVGLVLAVCAYAIVKFIAHAL